MHAQFGPYFDLRDLDGTNAMRFMGELRNSCTGSQGTVGDVNGDGLLDLIISAPCPGDVGQYPDEFPGKLYVVFGGAWFDQAVSAGMEELDGTNGFSIDGLEAAGYFGNSVVSGFDWNADGIDDLATGAPDVWVGANNDAGQVFVIFGHPGIGATGTFDLTTLGGSNGFVIDGLGVLEGLGGRLAVGDFNADAWPDLAMGASGYTTMPGRRHAGRVFVVFGGAGVGASGWFDLATLDGSNGFVANGIAAGDAAVVAANAGDLNDDGIEDLAIGAPGADPNGLDGAGQSYVVFGGPGIGAGGVIELGDLDGTNGFRVNGAGSNHHASGVSAAGDVNGDGVSDLVIGREGGAEVIFGGASVGASGVIEAATLTWPAGVRLRGSLVRSAGAIGDVNDDGLGEVALGARQASPEGRYEAGMVSVVFGEPSLGSDGMVDADLLDGTNGFYVYGDRSFLRLSTAYPLGDLNRDGVADFGVYGEYDRPDAPADRNHGAVYVIFGRSRFALGDLDRDGDVDDSDFASFLLCYGGSSRPPGPACPEGLDADLDNDGDVDLDDFSIFAANYTGSQ